MKLKTQKLGRRNVTPNLPIDIPDWLTMRVALKQIPQRIRNKRTC